MAEQPNPQGQPSSSAEAMKQTAATRGEDLRDTMREQARDVAGAARDHASDVVQTARSEGEQVLDRTVHALSEEARARTDDLARSLREFGHDLDALADGRPQDAGPVSGYARDAARRIDDVAQRIEARGYDGLVSDLSNFGRRRPGVFLLSAGALGLLVGRMVRSGAMGGEPSGSPAGAGMPPTNGLR